MDKIDTASLDCDHVQQSISSNRQRNLSASSSCSSINHPTEIRPRG